MSTKEYRKWWMRGKRALTEEIKRADKLRGQGRCIHCEMLLAESPGHDCSRPYKFIKDINT